MNAKDLKTLMQKFDAICKRYPECLECPLCGVCKCTCFTGEHSEEEFAAFIEAVEEHSSIPPADMKLVVYAENVADEYADCDQFICSECGIHLQDWVRIDEEDYQDRIVHEYVFKFCPNCGADMRPRGGAKA